MDIIYCRRKFRLPRPTRFPRDNKNLKKTIKMMVILSVGLLTFYSISNSIEPIFRELCIEKTRSVATIIINEEGDKALTGIDYSNLVSLIEDVKGNGNILKTDVVKINDIASNVALNVERKLQELENQEIEIPLGVLLGNKYLTGIGPSIAIKIIQTGNTTTDIKTEFEKIGINQTSYRVYLELVCNLSILTSYQTYREQIVNQVLLVETVISGDVPGTYYNLENVGKNQLTQMMD